MSRTRTQRIGSFKRVPSYCYPARRQFPIRWSLTLAVAIAWLLVLQSQQDTVRFEADRVVVLDTFEISLVGPELDAALDAYRVAELEPAPAAHRDDDLAEALRPAARRAGAPALEVASRPGQGGAPCGRDADGEAPAAPVAALPAGGPTSPEPQPSGDGPELDANTAGSTDLASRPGAGPADWPGPRITAPPSYDCLRLCGRGPPAVGVLS